MTDDSPAVALLTGRDHPDLTADGRALADELEHRGIHAAPVVWSTADVDRLGDYDAALIRACWDYHTDLDGFLSVLETLSASAVAVYNPLAVVRWNAHKSYYQDLAAAGLPVPPSVCLDAGADTSLEGILEAHGWAEAVVKPAVGAGSEGVWRTTLETAAADQQRFVAACADSDVVVQEYRPEIKHGERSLVFVDGEYSHAWNDPTKPDDFSDFEAPEFGYEPDDETRETARAVLDVACEQAGYTPADLPYARVDYVDSDDGLLVLEVELIEPNLELVGAGAVERLAEAVARRLR